MISTIVIDFINVNSPLYSDASGPKEKQVVIKLQIECVASFGIDYIMYNVCVQNERFTKIMFLLDRVQNNSSNWNSQVKNTLESLDMESTYTNFTPCNLPYTLYMYL